MRLAKDYELDSKHAVSKLSLPKCINSGGM